MAAKFFYSLSVLVAIFVTASSSLKCYEISQATGGTRQEANCEIGATHCLKATYDRTDEVMKRCSFANGCDYVRARSSEIKCYLCSDGDLCNGATSNLLTIAALFLPTVSFFAFHI